MLCFGGDGKVNGKVNIKFEINTIFLRIPNEKYFLAQILDTLVIVIMQPYLTKFTLLN